MANEAIPSADGSNNTLNSSQSTTAQTPPPSKKSSSVATLLDANGSPKPVKRRATKACATCRARKVRCDVMLRYHINADGGVTCSNCMMDGIKCVIGESKRMKKHMHAQPAALAPAPAQEPAAMHPQTWQNNLLNPTDIVKSRNSWRGDSTTMSNDIGNEFSAPQHIPHSIYQSVQRQISHGETRQCQNHHMPPFDADPTNALLDSASLHGKHVMDGYLKPLPERMTSADVDYLFSQGALCVPDIPVRNALFRSYFEFVHPYMPLVEIHDLMEIVEKGAGASGRISLLLFQAIMFAGTAFVDMEYLRSAGYSNRMVARKAFFQKARVLYDFDYELDRVSLVQSLLLMTYWYESPADQKDMWHWMGVAISLAHTIGLHRNPEDSTMEPCKKKLWKRIWWSCFMRDRLIALGMHRPTRVRDGDYDVPMLTEGDFEICALPDHITAIPRECTLARDVEAQRQLAQMCIAKAKLCLCISHVLSAQYSLLTRSSVMLFPKKLDQTDEVQSCDLELSQWVAKLPAACQYSNKLGIGNSAPSLFVNRALLNMAYFTTPSMLNRPQVLPLPATTKPNGSRELQDTSRRKVWEASCETTRISQDLFTHGLEKYLPTTGVTVLLPAAIIHLLDIKSCNDDARQAAIDGFCQCILVLERLHNIYASAVLASQFLEATIRKADIDTLIRLSMERFRLENPQIVDKLSEMRHSSESARWTPPPRTDDKHVLPPPAAVHHARDIRVPAGDPEVHSTIKNSLPSTISPLTPESEGADPLPKSGLEFTLAYPDAGADVDLSDALTFDNGSEMWNVPSEEGVHDESRELMEDINWVDDAPRWSRMTSPSLDVGGQYGVGAIFRVGQ